MTWSVASRLRRPVTKPTGTVDFTTIVADGFAAITSRTTASTDSVSKASLSGS